METIEVSTEVLEDLTCIKSDLDLEFDEILKRLLRYKEEIYF